MKKHLFLLQLCLVLSISAHIPSHNENHTLSQEYSELADHFEEIGKHEKAESLYTKALSLHPDNPHALVKLGNLYYSQRKQEQAMRQYEHAVRLGHQDASMHFNAGLCCQHKQEWHKAAEQFQKALDLDPTHVNAALHAGGAYEKSKQIVRALMAFKKASQLDPNSFEAWHQIGNLYRHVDQLENAIQPYRTATALQPDNLHVMMDLANVYNMLDQYENALEWYQCIIQKNANAFSALYNFGFTLKKMGKLDRALEIYQQVLAKKPDYAPVHFSLSSIYLTLGDLEKGWAEYEWRWKAYSENPKKSNAPEWKGESLDGKSILIYAEQGLGDTLQFIRYLKLLKEKYPDSRLVFETQASLTSLLKIQPYIDQVIPRRQHLPTCDYQIHVMSLPYVVRTRLETIPADIPYLAPDGQREAFWKEKVAQDTNFKIGICWQGNAQYTTQSLRRAVAKKSLPLQAMEPLSKLPGVSIYSLQQVNGLEQIPECTFKDSIVFFDEQFDTQHGAFMDTAAVMKQLDVVISVDTGVCHLAAAMGVPTWILLPFPADWRWMLNRSDSPWYPSVRLFRQPSAEDWQTPLQEIVKAIQEILQSKSNPPETTELQPHRPTPEQQQFFEQIIG